MSDAFDTLGLEPAFRLDSKRLEEVYQRLSATLHPDRHIGRPASERRAALGRAIEVNEAYRILKHPIERGHLLLERLGISKEAEIDQEFLVDIMELRESLRDAAQDEDEIERLASQVRERKERAEAELSESFEAALRGDLSSVGSNLADLLSKLRYYERFLTEADALVDELL